MTWIDSARDDLMGQQAGEHGWGYRPGCEPFVEPTALAALALLASAPDPRADRVVRRAADWLAEIQSPDGAVGLSARIPAPRWGTPYAILLWAALDGYQAERDQAVQWLLQSAGETWPADPCGVIAHDTSIPGWPWVEGTHSWVEPTAIALLALQRQGYGGHARTAQGIRMICDRALPGNAWNFGNRATFGSVYPPQLASTGFALLALISEECTGGLVQGGCQYLRRALPGVRAPRSLVWGLMGLDAWQQRPAQANQWLAESSAWVQRNRPNPLDLAQLILAAHHRSLDLLGARAEPRNELTTS
jgi:hypothetical protein